MKTSDLPVGSHVAFNYGSTSYESIKEAFVIATRARGTKSNYWGGKTGNSDTIGLAVRRPQWSENGSGIAQWEFAWTRPAQIVRLWSEHSDIKAKIAAREAEMHATHEAAVIDRENRWNSLPASVQALIPDWKVEDIINRNRASMDVSVEWIEKVIAAVLSDARTPAQKIADEVSSALALLAG